MANRFAKGFLIAVVTLIVTVTIVMIQRGCARGYEF